MPSKIRVHVQQFGIIHLPNPDLIYIRNPERNKILFVPFHLEGNADGNHDPRARIYTRGEVSFAKFLFLPS
jgi:hypothetical protein